MSQKLVVVLGATGTQGGSVVDALVKHGKYAVRAVTRDPDSAASKALKAKGVKVVSGTLADKDSLIKAFEGAYAVFGVTIPFTQDDEFLQGKNIVDASKAANVAVLVWSSLPNATEASNGKYTTVYHFDKKSEVDKYIPTSGQPTVILHTGGFAENTLKFHQLRQDATDKNRWNFVYPVLNPDVRIPGIWIEADLGNIVAAVIDHWEDPTWRKRLTSEVIVAAPYEISISGAVEVLRKVTGKDVVYVGETDVPAFQKDMYGFANEGLYKYPPQTIVQELGVKTHTFEDYAREKVLPHIQSATESVQ